MIVHPTIDKGDGAVDGRVGKRMPWPAERDGARGHGRRFLGETTAHEQKPKRLIALGARRGNVAIVCFATAIARDDGALVEHRLARTEDEVDMTPHFAVVKVAPSGVWKERILIPGDLHMLEYS